MTAIANRCRDADAIGFAHGEYSFGRGVNPFGRGEREGYDGYQSGTDTAHDRRQNSTSRYNLNVEPGTLIGRYIIRDQIGEGGMAEVFLAELSGAAGFSKRLAIKRVRGAYAFDAKVANAFVEEAQLAQRLQHGNIVQVYDLGLEGKCPYLVMEYVDGLSLEDVLLGARITERPLDVGDAIHIIERVSAALDYAHRLADDLGNPIGVIHRDVNPRNILISTDGVIKLTDFGIAKALHQPSRTLPGRVKGTLGYLSPEQARGDNLDARSDQFATGVVLYQLLAGRNPLAEVEDIGDYRALIERGLPPLRSRSVDAELSAAIARATAIDPKKRFASMAELRQVLEAWRVSRGIRTSLDGLRKAVRRYRGRRSVQMQARLDDAVLAQLGEQDEEGTRHLKAVAPAKRKRWPWVLAALFAAGLTIAVGAKLFSGSDGDAVAAASDADAAPVPTPTAQPDAAVVAVVDAAPPVPVPVAIDAAIAVDARVERVKRPRADAAPRRPEPKPIEPPPTKERGSGTIKVNVLPWAWVSIDGVRVGKTPIKRSLSAGPHVVELFNPQTGQRARRRIKLDAGKTVVVKRW